MLNKLLLCLAVTAVLHLSFAAGQSCDGSSACCINGEACCLDGCCRSSFPVCCSRSRSCCAASNPVCCPNNRCCTRNYPVCCPSGCCPQGSRCCSGGCCPASYPVCCSTHCCPSGSYCCSRGCCIFRFGRLARAIPLNIPEQNMSYSTLAVESDTVRTDIDEFMAHFAEASDGDQIAQHSIFTRQASFIGECNSYERMKLNEGYHTRVYYDTANPPNPTIGVGFNLAKAGAQRRIEDVGANYNNVLNGNQNLTHSQIITLFNADMNTAVTCAMMWLQEKWAILENGPRSAIVDMAFTLGCRGLSKFVRLRAALFECPPNLRLARVEMRDSDWCDQVKQGRCGRDIACMG